MSIYTAPDVYIEDVTSGQRTISQSSASVGAMVGATRSGVIGKAQLVTSWPDFISKYAYGLDSPFFNDSYLPYAVYGFFQNGGQQLYVSRAATSKAKKASGTGTVFSCSAATEGTWGNSVKVSLKKGKDYDETEGSENLEFDLTVSVGTNSATIEGVKFETLAEDIENTTSVSRIIGSFEYLSSVTALAEDEFVLSGGDDGIDGITALEYQAALNTFEEYIEEITMVAIPGGVTTPVRDALIGFCMDKCLFPIITAPMGTSIEDCRKLRKSIRSTYGAMPYPWGILTDPLTNKDKKVPPEGHYMGVCARVINARGEFKAPAGTEAYVLGFNSMETAISNVDCGILNPAGVTCLRAKKNYGIVVWGARGLNSSDDKMRYVSDHFLNICIHKDLYAGTQFALFEPNGDGLLWESLYTLCKNYLEAKRKKGAFVGNGEGTSYYVVCDETNNPQESVDEGYLNIEIGYAPVKPAEFIVIKLAHSIDSNV